MDFEDKTITCADCGTDFVHSAADQARYQERGLSNEPKRCPSCRAKRRTRQEGGRPGPRAPGGSSEARGGRRFSASAGSRPERESFPATCAACGKETTVPFRPVQGRPVYCRECYQLNKGR